MTANKLSSIDVKELEEQLECAIQADRKYWQQNEAKIKAVTTDHVETYDEFKNFVDAAHLKPLEKSDHPNRDKLGQTIWNKFADKGNRSKYDEDEEEDISKAYKNIEPGGTKPDGENKHNIVDTTCKVVEDERGPLPYNAVDKNKFLDILNASEDKLTFLTKLGAPQFVAIFQHEISTSTLLEVFKVLSSFDRNDVEQVLFVSEFLSELINIERFSLTLSFLNSKEKQIVESLFEKLNSCFILKGSELKDMDLDGDHLSALKIVYQL
uniref:Coiled-coil domain-containing protein 103 n=1 Tax=Cacopsylla melanoneura TaxID=428564 RepID=A0A8D8RCA0_9HEMI